MHEFIKQLLLFITIAAVNSLFWLGCYLNSWVLPNENGIVENTQTLFLCICFMIYINLTLKTSNRANQLLFGMLSFLCLSFTLREIPFEEYHLHPFIEALGHGREFAIWQAVCWISLSTYIGIRHRTAFIQVFKKWMSTPSGWAMILAAVLLNLATPFDKNDFNITPSYANFFEELMEINGYLLMLVAAVIDQKRGYFK